MKTKSYYKYVVIKTVIRKFHNITYLLKQHSTELGNSFQITL